MESFEHNSYNMMQQKKLESYYQKTLATESKTPVAKQGKMPPMETLLSPDKKLRHSERLAMLGIPKEELTPSVSLALSAMLEKMDDLSRELTRTKENLTEIERLVDVDCLAPIPNRRAFMRRLSWAIAMHERYNHPSSILYIDMNDFKRINDTYGHAAGDLAIRHVAQILSDNMRESDFLARIGGDEFASIMYYSSDESSREKGRKIAEQIAQTPFVFNGKKLTVTIAFGVYSLNKGDDAEAALANADTSMYLHKRKSKEQATNIKA